MKQAQEQMKKFKIAFVTLWTLWLSAFACDTKRRCGSCVGIESLKRVGCATLSSSESLTSESLTL